MAFPDGEDQGRARTPARASIRPGRSRRPRTSNEMFAMAVRSTIRSEPRRVRIRRRGRRQRGRPDASRARRVRRADAYEVFDLEGREGVLGSQFFERYSVISGDTADHSMRALHDGGDVAHSGAVAHFRIVRGRRVA